jgi:hypothetical protein
MSKWMVAALVGGVLMGVGVARWTAAPTRTVIVEGAERPSSAPAPAVAGVALDPLALRRELREAVRDELKAARAETAAAEPPAPRHQPTVENEAAHERASERIADALPAHRWTAEDAAAIGKLIPTMTSEERDQVLDQLLGAINRRELQWEGHGRPF